MRRVGVARRAVFSALLLVGAAQLASAPKAENMKGQPETAPLRSSKISSVFFPADIVRRMREAAESTPEGSAYRDSVIRAAGPWMWMDEQELWDSVVGPSLPRSWMVWSDGYCPACGESVPMYGWVVDPFAHPFKVQCPHCRGLFPTNDFAAFYRSGLDQGGLFDPGRADRGLLFNSAHPDPDDPLRAFGVDDGQGYAAAGNRWRFIGAYLVYGQWKRLVVGGIRALSDAYVMTGDPRYARNAGVLIDRVADLYPGYDFARQGFVYERAGNAGYVSVWHDAVEETREIALAYDKVFDAIRADRELLEFLSRQARVHRLPNPKTSFALVQQNIEERILRDALASPAKIHANFPRKEAAVAIISAILRWPSNREEVEATVERAATTATAVDGVTGEKGLSAYSAYTIQGLAELLALFDRADPGFLASALRRTPALARTWRFHLDTLCLGTYYPRSGDCGAFGEPTGGYIGVSLPPAVSTSPSLHTFLFRLFELTGDPAYARILWAANGGKVDGLPYDLAASDPANVRAAVRRAVEAEGADQHLQSVDMRQWHLAILRSGGAAEERALWLDYDSGGAHGHADGMTLGLFAKGMDLLPDFGYPPVQYGGWSSSRAAWYASTAAHNTVVVDRANQRVGDGASTLWAPGATVRAVVADGAVMIPGSRYERSALLVDIDVEDSYVVDVFRVRGGAEHVRSTGSLAGTVSAGGLALEAAGSAAVPGLPAELRILSAGRSPEASFWVEWSLPGGVRLRQTDFTRDAEAVMAEAWVSTAPGSYGGTQSTWVPRTLVRRRATGGDLESTFVAMIEPYAGTRRLQGAQRLEALLPSGASAPDSAVALEVRHASGSEDLILLPDGAEALRIPSWDTTFSGRICLLRRGTGGIDRIFVADARLLEVAGRRLLLRAPGFVEIEIAAGAPRVVSGDASLVQGH